MTNFRKTAQTVEFILSAQANQKPGFEKKKLAKLKALEFMAEHWLYPRLIFEPPAPWQRVPVVVLVNKIDLGKQDGSQRCINDGDQAARQCRNNE